MFIRADIMEILESRKAFALDRYQDNNVFNKKALERDTAALVLETSGQVHSFFLAILPDGTVVNPVLSKTKDVENFYADETHQTILEKIAGLKMRQALIEEPENTLVAWISPPGGEFKYDGATFEVGRIRKILGIKVLQTYGIPLKNVTGEYCERLFLMLEEFSNKSSQNINSPEELRDKISILIPHESRWIDFLGNVFPELSEVFTKIKNGDVHRVQMKAIKDAKVTVNDAFEGWEKPKENLVYIGAKIEKEMEKKGWSLTGGRCGLLNSDLLKIQNKAMFGMVEIKNTFGEKKSKYVKKCPYCDATIEKVIEPGYKCSCGQVFEGVC
jgi:hypothetical protein